MKELNKEEQRNLDAAIAELNAFLENNPKDQDAQKELELKLLTVPEEERLSTIFMMMGGSLNDLRSQFDSVKEVLNRDCFKDV